MQGGREGEATGPGVPSATGPGPIAGQADWRFTQTPFFRALQADRYARQDMIRQVQVLTGRALIVYEANESAPGCAINADDTRAFADLLHRLPEGCDLDLMIHSPGGDIEAAEKLVYMCRTVASTFRVIVPEMAKSAATLIALASDQIVMSFQSELGPIDAQLTGPGPGGALASYSAKSFVDAFEDIKKEVEETKYLSPAYYPLLQGINIGFLELCKNAAERSRMFAAKWLSKHMCKGDEGKAKADEIADALCDVRRWRSHGSVIDAEEANRLGISVETMDRKDDLWEGIWFLHCCYRTEFMRTRAAKIFESDVVSLSFE